MAIFHLHTHARFHRSQQKGYIMPVVELKNFLNDFVADSPHLVVQGTHRPRLIIQEVVELLREVF
jgi:hypothetical protein